MRSHYMVTPMQPGPGDAHILRDAFRQGKLLVARCAVCSQTYSHQEPGCPACRSTERQWGQSSGRGRLYSYVIAHHLRGRGGTPVTAIVELDEGPRVMADLVGIAPEQLGADSVGMAVEAAFLSDGAGDFTLAFRPAGDGQ